MIRTISICLILAMLVGTMDAPPAQEMGGASTANNAFEEGLWAQAINEYQILLSNDRLNGVYWLRIAQAQRELGQNVSALETLERARVAQAPEAMLELERARNFVILNQVEMAFQALQASDKLELRSLSLLDGVEEFSRLRSDNRFQLIYRSVRQRIYPCEAIPSTTDFNFWIGIWDVRLTNGTLIGRNTITKQDGGCSVIEKWEGGGGSSGSSTSFFVPSRDQWRHIWVGSGGALIDIMGTRTNGAMRMEGTIEYVGLNSVLAFRGSWTELPDGRVRQLFEEFNIGLGTWQIWFDGYYTLIQDP